MTEKSRDDESFVELPILVIHDTIISDILGEKEVTKYKDSSIFITNYFLTRQAIIGMGSGKSGVTASQVFKIFDDCIGSKTNTMQAIKDWIDETPFTTNLTHLDEKSSVYVYAHFIARRNIWKIGKRVILICNDNDIEEKLLYFYKQSGWNFKNIDQLPFAVMNTDQLKKHLRVIDKDNFDMINEIIESSNEQT